MSSYSLCGDYTAYGDDVMLGGKGWNKFKKFVSKTPIASAVKFVAHPIKETKAAVKTIARFDPTAKTAKYGNVTKGVLIGAAAVAGTVLTLGAGAGIAAIAAGSAPGVLGAAKLAGTKVRTPPKTIAPDLSVDPNAPTLTTSLPLNSFTDTTGVPSANAAIMQQYSSSAKKSDTNNMLLIGGGALAVITVLYLATK
jgi:hypothetical protein